MKYQEGISTEVASFLCSKMVTISTIPDRQTKLC